MAMGWPIRLVVFLAWASLAGAEPPVSAAAAEPSTAAAPAALPSAGFDETADPAADLERAKAEAKASHRRILMKIGGNWCVWCRAMAKFFHEDAEVAKALEAGYVLLRVNVSKANKNEAFLAGFPKVEGYPFLVVLDAEGAVVHPQETGSLESGQGYDRAKFLAFLTSWAPPAGD